MSLSGHELSPETIHKLEIVDTQNKRFRGKEIEQENLMSTKIDEHFISVTSDNNSNKTTFLVSIRNKEDTRTELRNVNSLKELSDVIVAELGMVLLYQSKPV